MEGLSGIDILRFMEANGIRTTVFLVTGRPSVEKALVDEGLRTLVTRVIGKPFDIGALIDEIKAL
jgi:hypothetical protein